ncbi:Inactive peptidyl-prolyl cis-trans isomerase shutdown [Gryllus bimaculatus]|nr:Inactive peptidyl-prolyl cis-trans isomerase shutdown [Gryllus bimaculatus]
MDVLNSVSTLSDEEPDNEDCIQHLVEGLNIRDLSESGTEFAVQVNEDAALEQQTSYKGPNLFHHLNLSCLGPAEDENNSDPAYDPTTDSPFTHLAKSMTNLTENGKVKKKILSEGYGEVVPENALVWFHYNSYTEDKDDPFDSSYLRGSIAMLRLNTGRCILGLDIGLSTMKCEEKADFLIHPDYAYGSLGVPPRIPSNATILMRVEMKKFVDNALAMKMGELTEEELKTTPFEEVHKASLSLLYSGNAEFSHKKYPVSAKLLGLAHLNLSSFDEAKKYAFLARKFAPNNPDVSSLLQKIEKKMERYNSSVVSFAKNAFGFENNKSVKMIQSVENDQVSSPENKTSGRQKIIEIEDSQEEKSKNKAPSGDTSLSAETSLQNDREAEFQKEAVSYIQECFDDPTVREIPLPISLSYEEEKFFLTQALMYGLRKEERREDGRTQIFFVK